MISGQLSTSQIEQEAAALESFASITLLIHSYEKVERIYANRHDRDLDFEELLVDLYVKILSCEVALSSHLERNGLSMSLSSTSEQPRVHSIDLS